MRFRATPILFAVVFFVAAPAFAADPKKTSKKAPEELPLMACVRPLGELGKSAEPELPARLSNARPVQLYGKPAWDWNDPSVPLVAARRLSYFGKKRDNRIAELNSLYGEGNWDVGYRYKDKWIGPEEAVQLYEDSYVAYFLKNPAKLDDMCRRASNVYDNNLSNAVSGTDWSIQESSSTHLQDIAVRRALKRLGRTFAGNEPLQIRGWRSPLGHLSPGVVPFVDPEGIQSPRHFKIGWVKKNSTEDFWQNNKYLVIKDSPETREHVKQELGKRMRSANAREWSSVEELFRYLLESDPGAATQVAKEMPAYFKAAGISEEQVADFLVETLRSGVLSPSRINDPIGSPQRVYTLRPILDWLDKPEEVLKKVAKMDRGSSSAPFTEIMQYLERLPRR